MMTEQSTVALTGDAAANAARLMKDELALAKDELRDDLARAKAPLIVASVGLTAAFIGAHLLLDTIAVESPRRAAVLSLVLLGGGVAATAFAWRGVPHRPLRETRARLAADARLATEALK